MKGIIASLMKEDSWSTAYARLARERLTAKQKHILAFVFEQERTASSLARHLSRELSCSRTAIWNNLRSLERAGLVVSVPGRPVRPTQTCLLIKEDLR